MNIVTGTSKLLKNYGVGTALRRVASFTICNLQTMPSMGLDVQQENITI